MPHFKAFGNMKQEFVEKFIIKPQMTKLSTLRLLLILFGKYSNSFLNPPIINSNIERTLMQWPFEKKKKILLGVDSQYVYWDSKLLGPVVYFADPV